MARHGNFVLIGMPSGATTFTVDPQTSGTVMAGARFAPTAGRRLVLVCCGPVTHTQQGTAWTSPANSGVANNGGLYLFHKLAAGGDTFSDAINGSGNFKSAFLWLEFEAGSTFLASNVASAVSKSAGAGPTLTTSAGTKTYYAFGNQAYGSTTGTPAWSAWGNSAVEFVDAFTVAAGGFEGYSVGCAYLEDSTTTSQSIAATLTSAEANTVERLIFAVQVAATAVTGRSRRVGKRR